MLESERLLIIPLNLEQILMYKKNDGSIEKNLKLNEYEREISEELEEALNENIIPALKNPDNNYIFFTLWTIILKSENKIIGDLCFTGEPDENKNLEIGYGVYPEFRNFGYMTEAVSKITEWAKKIQIKSITASTEKNNPASFKVLTKNNFSKISENSTLYNLKLIL